MKGILYRVRYTDNVASYVGEKGNRQKQLSERVLYLEVVLPPVNPPAEGNNDVEDVNSGRITNKAIRLEQIERKFNQTSFSGEEQGEFERLAKKALSDNQSQEKLLYMLEKNKQVKQKIAINYCIMLRIVKNSNGYWDWATEYSNHDVTTEKLDTELYKPTAIKQEWSGQLGMIIGEDAEEVIMPLNRIETAPEVSLRKKTNRFMWSDKIECLSSTARIENVVNKKESFTFKEDGGEWQSSIIKLNELFSCPEYYEDDDTLDNEWSSLFGKELRDNEDYRDAISLLSSIVLACPAGKKVFIVCDYDKQKEGKNLNQGCGHNAGKCHTKFVREQIINACTNSSGKNIAAEKALEYSKCWIVNKKDIK